MSGTAASLLLMMAAEAVDLTLPFGESSRPPVCTVGAGTPDAPGDAARPGPWDRVRAEPVEALCLGLARAQVRLARDPAGALAAARALAAAWPGRSEPRVLEARALAAQREYLASWQLWQAAGGLRPDGAGEPAGPALSAYALRDYALTAALTGHTEVAGATYRRLVSLLDAWPDPRHVERLYIEAAAAALRRGPTHRDEAVGYLLGAQSSAASTGLRAYVVGMLAWLQAERMGKTEDTVRLDAAEVWHFVALARAQQQPSYWPVVPRYEALAVASMLIEPYSFAEASELWDGYVTGLTQSSAEASGLGFARERQARLHARAAGSP